jgi:phosphatidylglycerol:prolipoprotein diacylglycerol transferase
MPGPWIHDIDPILGKVGGFYLWWYGLGYTLGFLEMHLFLRRRRDRLHLTLREVYSLTLFLAVGILVGGRFIEVAFDEWPFYREHPRLIPAYWLGGMATHGILLGAATAAIAFAAIYKVSLLSLADELVIPGALLMGVGRIGNFIDGQIVGSPTDGWWGVKFPDAEGFRHPVVLYDGLKNLLLVPYLLWVRRTNPTPGATAARFVFWYAFLRLFIDLLRDYPTHRLALGTGQTLNICMALLGAVLLFRSRLRRLGRVRPLAIPSRHPAAGPGAKPLLVQQVALVVLLLVCLVMPSNWTQDVPARYGKRHAGLEHSWLYPAIDTRPSAKPDATTAPGGAPGGANPVGRPPS